MSLLRQKGGTVTRPTHYILTRSAYAPDVPARVNHLRVELLARVTARSLAAQTCRDATWLLLIDEADPLLAKRIAAAESSGLRVIARPAGNLTRAFEDRDRPQGPWSDFIEWDGPILTTRLDDDDALAPWVLEMLAARRVDARTVWDLPVGWRVRGRTASRAVIPAGQFASLYAPAGDRTTVMVDRHLALGDHAPREPASSDPAWLWIRHRNARSAYSPSSVLRRTRLLTAGPARRIDAALRAAFDIDWALVEGLR